MGSREPIKAITIWQPWASLLAHRVKTYETRSWWTAYRGPIAIHAAAITVSRVLKECFPMSKWDNHPDHEAKMRFLAAISEGLKGCYTVEEIARVLDELPTGSVIATANLTGCYRIMGPRQIEKVMRLDEPQIIGGDRSMKRNYIPTIIAPNPVENALGDWTPGRYAWEFSDMKLIDPIPAKGKQGLWNWEGVAR